MLSLEHMTSGRYSTACPARCVVAIEAGDVDQWLVGTLADAQALLRAPAPEVLGTQA